MQITDGDAKECEFTVGDKILLKQDKGNKLTPAFESDPYKVIENGNIVTIQSTEGVQYIPEKFLSLETI